MARGADEEVGFLRLGQPAVRDAALHGDAIGLKSAEKLRIAILDKTIERRGKVAKTSVIVQIGIMEIVDSEVHGNSKQKSLRSDSGGFATDINGFRHGGV